MRETMTSRAHPYVRSLAAAWLLCAAGMLGCVVDAPPESDPVESEEEVDIAADELSLGTPICTAQQAFACKQECAPLASICLAGQCGCQQVSPTGGGGEVPPELPSQCFGSCLCMDYLTGVYEMGQKYPTPTSACNCLCPAGSVPVY